MPDPLDITDISVAENGKYNDCVVFKLQLFCAKQLVTPPLSSPAASSFYPQTDCLGTMVHVTLDSKLTSEKDICHPKHQGRNEYGVKSRKSLQSLRTHLVAKRQNK